MPKTVNIDFYRVVMPENAATTFDVDVGSSGQGAHPRPDHITFEVSAMVVQFLGYVVGADPVARTIDVKKPMKLDGFHASCLSSNSVNPYVIMAEAKVIAAAQGLVGWTIELADSDANMGTCDWDAKTIKLAPRHITSVSEARDTVLHETAHALQVVSHGTAHNAVLHELRHRHNRIE